MYDVIVFGGTGEGRVLAEALSDRNVPSLICTATQYGGELLDIASPSVSLSTRRLNRDDILSLLSREKPRLVIDATHPYAQQLTEQLTDVCEKLGLSRLRVLRESLPTDGCVSVGGTQELIASLNARSGVIFSALGAKEAAALCEVTDFKERVYLRILPLPEALSACLSLGYPAGHIICAQGPFSYALNRAMLEQCGASVLVTKESGAPGGFEEKRRAALDLGVEVIVLRRPPERGGCSISQVLAIIGEQF